MQKPRHMSRMIRAITPFFCLMVLRLSIHADAATNQLPVGSPLTTDSAGYRSLVAKSAVMRLICPVSNSMGTGFFHKSGKIITAAHVIKGCKPEQILIVTASGGQNVFGTNVVIDSAQDLAIIWPSIALQLPSLPLGTDDGLVSGTQVSAWGFPAGYNGEEPLLTVGHIAGSERIAVGDDSFVRRWVVNAAFNSGNSGGPVLKIEDGTIIGVVASKLAPLPREIESTLKALSQNSFGMMYTATKSDGTSISLSEAQVIEQVLQFLRSQTQLVIGHAVQVGTLKDFLRKNGIDP
jgi:S1-C subfamily serine protease